MANVDGKVTARSLVIGLLFTFCAAVMAHLSINIVHGSYMAIDHMPVAAISLFLALLLLLHLPLRVCRKWLNLSTAEMLVIYIMCFVGCSVATMGLGSQVLPIIGAPYYYATPTNEWDKVLLPHIRTWMTPQNREAVRQFFEGGPPGAPIPWGVWIRPLLAWMPFLMALHVVMITIPVIMRKQWIERERLLFPLAHLPVEMVRKEDTPDGPRYTFFRNRVMWFGFALPFAISSINGLHHYLNFCPNLELVWLVPTFRRTQSLEFRISFAVIGFIFLVGLQISFSLFFFALTSHVISGVLKVMGVTSTENLGPYGSRDVIFSHLGMGALIVFVMYGLWTARFHLKDVFRKAFRGDRDIDDSSEIMSYRAAVFSMLISVLVLVVWLTASGLPPGLALLFVLLALVIFLGVTRIVVEAGVPTMISPGIASPHLISTVGTRALGPSGLAALAFTYIYAADIRTFAMSAASTSLRIAESIRGRRRLIFWAMLAGILVSLTTALVIDLILAYRHGGLNLNRWFFQGNALACFSFMKGKISHPSEPNWLGYGLKCVGGCGFAVLMFMRDRFLWWPLHPIGFVIGATGWIQKLWFSIFIAWLLKSFTIKYGGPKVFRRVRPFFFGLVLGQYSVAAVWFFIDLIFGESGNTVFWI